MQHRPLQAAASLLLLSAVLLGGSARAASAASFTVHDGRSEREISEATRLYIDDRLVAAFDLNDQIPQRTIAVQLVDGSSTHRYDLCGSITIRKDDGGAETHEVNATGLLHDPDRHQYEALGARNFTLFYLLDPTAPEAAEIRPERSSVCTTPTS